MNKINTCVLRNEQTLISQRGFSKKNKYFSILWKILKKGSQWYNSTEES